MTQESENETEDHKVPVTLSPYTRDAIQAQKYYEELKLRDSDGE